ncbi:hypothetical protein Scep_017174 [Stephania cephalantha]|uniref:Uncharacterized protein n=1 Tax=Stephania cephalantha TaxID=152367 RepID=A0AAP0NWN1_9MAGN
MEEGPEIHSILMDTTVIKIFRSSIHKFLKSYQHFTFTSLLLCLPFSASILLSQALVPSMSPLLLPIHLRLQSLFDSSGFMPSSHFFSPFNLKLSQAISSSVFTLPFNLSFFLLSRASAIQSLKTNNTDCTSLSPCLVSFLSRYKKIFVTHVSNSFIILSINSSGFFILLLVFHSIDACGFISPNFFLFVFAAGVVIQSVVVANAYITCNLALIVAGMESSCSGYLAVFNACQLIRGRASTALFLAFPVNLGLSALEALFQMRVVTAFHLSANKITCSIALEGLLIAYLHSLLIVVDTIITCMFYKCCKSGCVAYGDNGDHFRYELHLEDANGRSANARALQLPLMA